MRRGRRPRRPRSPAPGPRAAPAPPDAITGTLTACATARRQLEVVAGGGAVAVHARQQDLPRAPATASVAHSTTSRPVGSAAPGQVCLPTVRARLRVDREHHALGAEGVRELVDQLGALERGRVDRDLVGTRVEHGLGVGHGADPAADRERNEQLVGGAASELDHRRALVRRGGDVEEHELVGTGGAVARGELDRVARVTQVDEPDALDHPAAVDVEARDHTLVVHPRPARSTPAARRRPRSAARRAPCRRSRR